VYLVIEEVGSGDVLGAIDLRFPDRDDRQVAELGYLLVAAARGRGVMSRAVRLLVGWGFAELDLARIQAMTHPDNAASARVLERLGFTREGLLRSLRVPGLRDGAPAREDRVMWSVLPRELVE